MVVQINSFEEDDDFETFSFDIGTITLITAMLIKWKENWNCGF